MRKFLAAVAAACAVSVAPAVAADMAIKAPPIVPPPVYSWTGCYIGGNGGGLYAHKHWTNVNNGNTLADEDVNGGLGGAEAGCNYEVQGHWVFGVQGDYDWTTAKGSYANLTTTHFYNTSITSLASVTARAGYAWDRFLGYVKGGGAWERDSYNTAILATGAIEAVAGQTRSGWTAGVGGEYAITSMITGFVEYDYYGFGTRTVPFTLLASGLNINYGIREDKSVIKAGFNLKFGG
jgi:outer membrane immunogenic protein